MRRIASTCAAAALLVLVVCLAGPPAAASPGGMIKYSSPVVRLHTDIGKDEAGKVMDHVTFFDDYIDSFFKAYGFSSRRRNPIRIRLYGTRLGYDEHRRRTNAPQFAAAYYSPNDNCIVASYDGGEEQAVKVLMHECAHIIQRRYIPNLVPWIDEGLACYFGATDFDHYRNVISACDRARLESLRSMIERDRLLDWKMFFEIQKPQLDLDFRQGRLNVGAFYSQSWGVTFFYLNSPNEEVRELFTRFLKGMNTGRGRSKMILQDMLKREAEFRDFISGPGHADVFKRFKEARKLRERKSYSEALNRLDAILAKDPGHVAALRLSAEIAWDAGTHADSLERWQRLAELDPDEKAYKWMICRCLTEIALKSGSEEDLQKAVAGGEEAVRATRSRDPDCLAALAMAYHAAGRLKEALATMRKATRFKCEGIKHYKRLEQRYSEELRGGK
jgi:YD repeat-containing protein